MLSVFRFDHRRHDGVLIYLDICCFNRPFDQQTQTLVRLQTEAKLAVQRGVRDGQLGLVWSAVLKLENVGNPDAERAEAIALWRDLAGVDVPTTQRSKSLPKPSPDAALRQWTHCMWRALSSLAQLGC